ncbi:MAG: Gfo/Idh/MocA family protein [Bacteroidota bacterium]
MKSILLSLAFSFVLSLGMTAPLRVGVAGLSHDHVGWILGRTQRGDIEVVGIAEANQELVSRYRTRYNLPASLFYTSLEEMIAKAKPEAVTAFGSILDHLSVVEVCAPKGIHVMVEKPLAVSLDHAKKMAALAKRHNVHVLTNYETTWYATNHKAYDLLQNGELGTLRKVVIHDGHSGPKEIGVSKEFFQWLTDPVQNGGGAVIDFGCYGANLLTWLTRGQRPVTVSASLRQHKPDIYPKVDDEATIVVDYDGSQGIIQASWNWPFGRKDMEVYGATGYAMSDNRTQLRVRKAGAEELKELLPERTAPYDDPFALLEAVVRNKITLPAYDLSSLDNNLLVMEILDAARESAKTGKAVKLK